ncbi:hypothetical protein KC949_03370 [Candidatus Saccharibacteria bacterium]|nr:hypothetical protein [Candidatus Saccharibacteria bacterium]
MAKNTDKQANNKQTDNNHSTLSDFHLSFELDKTWSDAKKNSKERTSIY